MKINIPFITRWPLRGGSRGIFGVTVMLTLLLLLTTLPFLVRYFRQESRWSVKEAHSKNAFQLAQAGLEKAYHELAVSPGNIQAVLNGTALPTSLAWFNGSIQNDISGGSYRVNVQATGNPGEIQITSTGRDFAGREFRTIQGLYRVTILPPLMARVIGPPAKGMVWWGPMMSLTEIKLEGSAVTDQLYPRKFAMGKVDTGGSGYPQRDINPNPPNRGPQAAPYTEWWSFGESPVADIAPPDLAVFRAIAQTQGTLYSGSMNSQVTDRVDTVCEVSPGNPKVYFYDNNVRFRGNTYFCGVLIVLGDLTFQGQGADPAGRVTVNPPPAAWREYQLNVPVHASATEGGAISNWNFYAANGTHPGSCQLPTANPHGDTDAQDEYPGDGGFHTVKPFTFGTGAGGAPALPLSFKGFAYVGGDYRANEDTLIHGAVFLGGRTPNTGKVHETGHIFYDHTISTMTGMTSLNKLTQVYWHEVPGQAF